MKYLFVVLSVLLAALAWGEELTLEQFMTQVRATNEGLQASQQIRSGSRSRAHESDLLYMPSLFLSSGYITDQRATQIPAFMGTRTDSFNTSLGVSALTPVGLSGRLYYSLSHLTIWGITPEVNVFMGAPTLELSQSFWRNGFGSETRATREILEASALATQQLETFKLQISLAEAEMNYWRLALARRSVLIQKNTLERSRVLVDWAARRMRLNLGEKSDWLQAVAGYKMREIDYTLALNEQRAAEMAFNSTLQREGTNVAETLEDPKPEQLLKWVTPQKSAMRADVLAAEQSSRLAAANAQLGEEKNRPTLDLKAGLSLNSRDAAVGSSLSNSFATQNPYVSVGLNFSVPLDFAQLARDRAGYALEQSGAQLQYKRKLYEQERDWSDLLSKIDETRQRLKLAIELRKAQEEKFSFERERLNKGRSTTYQVLLFEQDYAVSELNLVRTQGELLRLATQAKLYAKESD